MLKKRSVSKCSFEEREPSLNLMRNLVLKAARPALLLLITREPVGTALS